MKRIAVLGLGLLGSEVAIRLRAQGFDVTGWNRSPGRVEALAVTGVQVAAGPAEAISAAEATLVLLSDAAAIEETLAGAGVAESLPGRVLIQMGTIAPDESRRLAEEVAAAGGAYLEAPVLGSLPEARDGRLIVMAGGDPELYRRCLPILEALSESPQHIGDLGQGAALKLAMNQLIAGLTATFSLSLGLVRAEGIEVDQFMELLRGSALYAPTFDKKLAKYLAHDYGTANFPLKHLRKDINLFREVAMRSGLDEAPLAVLVDACDRAIDAGLGDADYSAIYEALVQSRSRESD
jgi:3-hydroxyisobutyrate dehydrogenase